MVRPTIHLYGTSGDELLRQITEARDQLASALIALQATAPYGRDFPGPGAIEIATAEYRERVTKLQAVLDVLCELYEHIDEHIEARHER
jgi:hypothetical protein